MDPSSLNDVARLRMVDASRKQGGVDPAAEKSVAAIKQRGLGGKPEKV
jgi:hypothetical protein